MAYFAARDRRVFRSLVFFLGLALLGLGLPLGKLLFFLQSPAVSASLGVEERILQVRRNEPPSEIAQALFAEGLITSREQFLWGGKLLRQWRQVKAGEYALSAHQSPLEIFEVLTSGVSVTHPVTIREGENLFEVADDLAIQGLADRKKWIDLCRNPKFIATFAPWSQPTAAPPSLEGYLFPDTYHLDRAMAPQEMVRQMVQHFFELWTPEFQGRAESLGLSRHAVLTLASIIEKETGAAEERPLISSVFHNRLKKKMKLQSDPTTIYGMWERFQGKIHKEDLFAVNAYNTYTLPGLPAGPIGNPGLEAIRAALYPAESSYLYFVSHNDGTHQFSETLEAHNRAVAKYQLDRKMREGKSWRDHLRKTASTPTP
jgi:UPF0755 protein